MTYDNLCLTFSHHLTTVVVIIYKLLNLLRHLVVMLFVLIEGL